MIQLFCVKVVGFIPCVTTVKIVIGAVCKQIRRQEMCSSISARLLEEPDLMWETVLGDET